MTRKSANLQPPRLAAWLVDLFCPANQAESILGDLNEEFSDRAGVSGASGACRWYWRQSTKTIADFAAAAFSSAPSWLAAAVLLGLLLSWFGRELPEQLIVVLLRTQRPYSNRHMDAYLAFLNSGIPIARMLESLLIGTLVAVLAKGREMVATLTLSIIRVVPIPWLLYLMYVRMAPNPPTLDAVLRFFLLSRALDLIGIVVAGVLVRKIRSVSSQVPAVT
jgi:hypothetical protein